MILSFMWTKQLTMHLSLGLLSHLSSLLPFLNDNTNKIKMQQKQVTKSFLKENKHIYRVGDIDSHLVWLVFRLPSLHVLVFLQKTFLWLVSVAFFFVLSFRNGKREERWEGRSRGRCMVNFFVYIQLRIVINSNVSKWNCKSIHHTFLSTGV